MIPLPSTDLVVMFSPVAAGLLIVTFVDRYHRSWRYRRARARRFFGGVRDLARLLAYANAPRWNDLATVERHRLAIEAAETVTPPCTMPGTPRRRVIAGGQVWSPQPPPAA